MDETLKSVTTWEGKDITKMTKAELLRLVKLLFDERDNYIIPKYGLKHGKA